MNPYLKALKDGLKEAHNCDATHVSSVPIKEVFQGKTVWDGTVEVFELHGHPKAKRAYGWGYEQDGSTKYITVLDIPPVDSPITAVRAAIRSGNNN